MCRIGMTYSGFLPPVSRVTGDASLPASVWEPRPPFFGRQHSDFPKSELVSEGLFGHSSSKYDSKVNMSGMDGKLTV